MIKRKAQSTLEYALIISVVAGALIATQVYVKRGVQGKLKSSADDISAIQYDAETGSYYQKSELLGSRVEISESGDKYGAGKAGASRRYTQSSYNIIAESETATDDRAKTIE